MLTRYTRLVVLPMLILSLFTVPSGDLLAKKKSAKKTGATAAEPAAIPSETPKDAILIETPETQSQERKPVSNTLLTWLKKLKDRAARTQAKHNQLVAVAAVRGSETKDAPPLYWKGKKGDAPISAEELKAFEEAVDAAMANDPASESKLESFVASYPKSPLLAEANQTLEMLKAEASAAE